MKRSRKPPGNSYLRHNYTMTQTIDFVAFVDRLPHLKDGALRITLVKFQPLGAIANK